jgi:hypothetical protein
LAVDSFQINTMTNLRKKILKWTIFLISGLILIALTGFAFLYFEAQTYLNKNLSEFVQKKSKGKYELTFDNLEINFSHWGIEINNIKFNPSDSILKTIDQSATHKQFYSFSSPNIQFVGIRFIQLIFGRKLEIAEILINQPDLNIHGKQTQTGDKKNDFSSLFQELKPLVTKTFKSVKIGKIELNHASFDFYSLLGDTRKLSNAEDITIGVLNFYTDSLLLPNPDKLFNAEDIYLRMHHYQNKMADSLHTLNAETVTYSLKHSRIDAVNIELKPTDQKLSFKGKYSIFVTALRITSKRIKEFYRNSAIPIDSMILADANIKYWPGKKSAKSKLANAEGYNLYELIQNEFQSLTIQYFRIKNARLKLFRAQNDTASQQELQNIAISLTDFKLDSISRQDTSRIFYSRNIDLSASGYEFTLGDNKHRIKVGNLELSTHNKSLLVSNIQIHPLTGQLKNTNQDNTIEANCDSIRLDSFNFKKAYHEQRFQFQKINVFNPEVKLTQNEEAKKDTVREDSSFIYKLISDYAKGIYSNQVLVQKGKVQLINQTGVIETGNIQANIRLQLSGFALDEISARKTDRLFFANQIELNFSDYQMQLVDQLHKLTIANFNLSTRKNLATIEKLHLFPVSKENMESLLKRYNRSELYEFTIPKLSLNNADFHNAFFNKNLSVDTLAIEAPQVYYENFALLKKLKPKAEFEDLHELLSSYLENIHIGKVIIPDGTILLINHSKKDKTITLNNHFSLRLENTLINKAQLNKKKLLFSEFVDFSVRDHLIYLSDNIHVLEAGEVGFSTRQKEIFVTKAKLYPQAGSKDFPSILWNIQLYIPEIRIKGIDMEKFYFDHQIDADNLQISAPDIKLYHKQKNSNPKELKEVQFPLPKEIESIAIRQFNLNDGSLKVFSEIATKPYLMVQSDIKMTAQDILIQKNNIGRNPEFKEGKYTCKLIQFKFTPKDKNQQFAIDELSFSTSDRKILATNLSLMAKTKSSKEDQFELRIPSLSMNGFDMDNAYKNNQYSFESIVVDKPSFQLFNNTRDSVRFNPFRINLYSHFESFADAFSTKSLNVKDADIIVFKNGQKKLQEKLTFNLANVRIDRNPSQGFMHAVDFAFKIPNLKRQGKLYEYTIAETSYSSKTNMLSAKDIRIIPRFSKEKHQQQVGVQSDYFSGRIDSVVLSQPNIKRWFEKEELTGKCMSVNTLNLELYRDKQIKFDETRRPKMIQDMIKSLKYPVLLDSLKLTNSTINYTEQPATGEAEGKIWFTQIHTRLMPFTNMKTAKGVIPDFKLDGSASIMDSCQLNVRMNFQMNNPENLFTAEGSLSPFNMHILNPITEPLAMVSLRSGHVDRFDFSFSGNKTIAKGQLFFGYNDLRISVLETKRGNTKESRFASFLANSLMLKSKNPRGKEFLPEEISFVKDQKRSDLNFWWKSIFSGIRNTLGIKESKTENPE